MRSLSALSYLVLLAALAACAPERAPETSGSAPAQQVERRASLLGRSKSYDEAQSLVRGAKLLCQEGESCSPSVGLFGFVDQKGWGLCTATLVAPDIIVTNAHCVPEDLHRPGADCRDRAWLTFADVAGHPEYEKQLGCERVLSVQGSETSDANEPDVAFLKVNRVQARPNLVITRAGIDEGESFRIDKVDPGYTKQGIRATQHEVSCQAFQHTHVLQSFVSLFSDTALLANCADILKGNSGSGLRDAAGRLRGVLFATQDGIKYVELLEYYERLRTKFRGGLQRFGYATNFACLKFPRELNLTGAPAACASRPTENESTHAYLAAVESKASDYKAANRRKFPAYSWFSWETISREPDARLEPTCVERDLVKVGDPVPVGQIHFGVNTTRDAYSRFVELVLFATELAPEEIVVGEPRNDIYPVRIAGVERQLPVCP